MVATYSKGQKPRDLDAAKGGLVLERTQNWQKDPDEFHPMGSGMMGPFNTQSYAKGAKGTDGDEKRTGGKSEKPIVPRK
jgi:hypothetical protein